jgi:RND family efflux transporter MFP subunit
MTLTTSRKSLVIGGLVVVAIGAFITFRLLSADTTAEARRQPVPVVRVSLPERKTITRTLKFTGDVAPTQQAAIFSKVNGTLERVYADIGIHVARGQRLALIDTTELAQQLQQASATYQNALLAYRRTNDLAAQKLVSTQDLDNAATALQIAEAANEAAKTRLGYAQIMAPFAGYVTRRFLDPGALVSPSVTLFNLMDLDEMKILINVLERDIPLIAEGKDASVIVDAYPGKEFHGIVRRYSQAVDLNTRTMPVEIDIANPSHLLKPGMYASVSLVVRKDENVLTVPMGAILKDQAGPYVFVVERDTARRVGVTQGAETDDAIEITAGLKGNESLITTGQQLVRANGPVAIQK